MEPSEKDEVRPGLIGTTFLWWALIGWGQGRGVLSRFAVPYSCFSTDRYMNVAG